MMDTARCGCKVISVSNQKGGVGKTVTCVNLGIGLAREGKKVLMIDADLQGSLSISLGVQEPDKLSYSLATVMMNIINDEAFDVRKGIVRHEEGVDLLPGNIELSGLEISLIGVISRETILREYIEQVREFYDYIIIDCMPSLGMLTINALACADSVLIPVQAAYLPVKGLQQLIKTIGRVKRQLNPGLKFEGILLTMVDNRTNYAKDIATLVYDAYSTSSHAQVRRYVRLTELIPKLLDMVDEKRLALAMAVEISYFNRNVQQWLYEYIKENGMIKQEQIMELRQYREDKSMTQEQLIGILVKSRSTTEKRKKITITERKLNKYFPAYYSQTEIERVIVGLLEQWKAEQEA